MKPIWIELVDKGVANRFDMGKTELIEMNWRLTEHPALYRRIFLHEIEHSDGKFVIKDLIHDLKSKTTGLHAFMLKNPSTWTQVLPFYWDCRKKTLVYDISAIVSWLMLLGVCYGIYAFLRWFL